MDINANPGFKVGLYEAPEQAGSFLMNIEPAMMIPVLNLRPTEVNAFTAKFAAAFSAKLKQKQPDAGASITIERRRNNDGVSPVEITMAVPNATKETIVELRRLIEQTYTEIGEPEVHGVDGAPMLKSGQYRSVSQRPSRGGP